MVSKSMRCAAEAARKAVARMLADEESSSLASAAGDPSPAVAIQQQAVPVVNSPLVSHHVRQIHPLRLQRVLQIAM
uniref:Uncharacterized protein n=1 Tax=Peronospora matthiolae TaxID=2874970 RepID=A0AAV1U4S1_9STRA